MPIQQSQIHGLSHIELLAKQVVEGFITGLHKSPFHGFSVEFAEHRLYNTGEPTRHIDWKLYGRTDKLFVKRYEEETNLRCHLILDCSSSMYYPGHDRKNKEIQNKVTFSVYACAALMHLLKLQRDAVGLSVFSEKVETHTPARSSSVHHKLLLHRLEEVLDSEKEQTKTYAAKALHEIAENIHRRSLVVIFSDMFESPGHEASELFNALQHLKYNKHEVILFHVTDKKKEEQFDFENRPYQFIDLESGEKLKVHSSKVKEAYIESMSAFKKELKMRCAQYRIDFVEADIHAGFNQVLQSYLIRRQKMV